MGVMEQTSSGSPSTLRGAPRPPLLLPLSSLSTASSFVAADVKALAMTHTTEAIETLVAIMRDKKAAATSRGAAAAQLLDRAIGKPEVSAKIENTTAEKGPAFDPTKLTEADWTVLESLRP